MAGISQAQLGIDSAKLALATQASQLLSSRLGPGAAAGGAGAGGASPDSLRRAFAALPRPALRSVASDDKWSSVHTSPASAAGSAAPSPSNTFGPSALDPAAFAHVYGSGGSGRPGSSRGSTPMSTPPRSSRKPASSLEASPFDPSKLPHAVRDGLGLAAEGDALLREELRAATTARANMADELDETLDELELESEKSESPSKLRLGLCARPLLTALGERLVALYRGAERTLKSGLRHTLNRRKGGPETRSFCLLSQAWRRSSRPCATSSRSRCRRCSASRLRCARRRRAARPAANPSRVPVCAARTLNANGQSRVTLSLQ